MALSAESESAILRVDIHRTDSWRLSNLIIRKVPLLACTSVHSRAQILRSLLKGGDDITASALIALATSMATTNYVYMYSNKTTHI
jgi:hypothetical protein